MYSAVNLSEARRKLPELTDKAYAGEIFYVSRRGRELAVLIGIDEYRRLLAIEQQQREMDFKTLLAPPPSKSPSEEEARKLAVQIVREQRASYDSSSE